MDILSLSALGFLVMSALSYFFTYQSYCRLSCGVICRQSPLPRCLLPPPPPPTSSNTCLPFTEVMPVGAKEEDTSLSGIRFNSRSSLIDTNLGEKDG